MPCNARVGLAISTMVMCLFYSGVIYGWTGIKNMLDSLEVVKGPDADTTLDIIMTVASSVTAGSGVIVGSYLDKVGPRITVLTAGCIIIVGCFVFGFIGHYWSYMVGYACFAFGGMGILISSFRIGYLFPKSRSLIIGSVSCLFDAASVVFVLFQLMFEHLHVEVKYIFLGYAIFTVAMLIINFILWTKVTANEKAKEDEQDLLSPKTKALSPGYGTLGPESEVGANPSMVASGDARRHRKSFFEEEDVVGIDFTGRSRAASTASRQRRRTQSFVSRASRNSVASRTSFASIADGVVGANEKGGAANMADLISDVQAPTTNKGGINKDADDTTDYIYVADRPLRQQLCSPEFFFIYVFCVLNMFKTNTYLGTMPFFMDSIGDQGHTYQTIVGFTIPAAFLFVPLIGWVLGKKGFAMAGYWVVGLAIAYGSLTLIHNLKVQIATGLVYTFYRAMLFSMVADFNVQIFGVKSVGRVTGILYTTTAALIPLQIVFVHLGKTHGWRWIHVGLTAVMLVPLALVIWIHRTSKEVGKPEPIEDEQEEDALVP